MTRRARRMQAWIGVALALGACGAQPRPRDPFRATGELIALSGGDGGAAHACFTCHGRDGAGDGQAAPRLAGLSRGYLRKQLDDYASGRRVDALMSPIAGSLGDEDRARVAAYYESLASLAHRSPRGSALGARLYHQGEPSRGVPPCADCHGPDGAGDAASPPLAGQPPAYLAAQLTRWSKGERRNDPRGVMLRISQRLSPSGAAAVTAYAAGLGAGSPQAP